MLNTIKRGRGRPRKYKNDEPKVLKKRGRKKKMDKIVCNLNDFKKMQIKSEKIINKSIIVHLPININEIEQNNIFEKDFLKYNIHNLKEPIGYDFKNNSLMQVKEEQIDSYIKNSKEYKIKNDKKLISKKISNLMPEFINFKDNKYFRTDILCWNCCHKFDNMPCGIPYKYEDEIFHVKGIFCSFNCALRYNYESKFNESDIQERESLLNLMYKKIHDVKEADISYAPIKETLVEFGGLLSIKDFRKNSKSYTLVYPPMMSIIPQLEEIKILKNTNEKKIVTTKKKNMLDNLFKIN